MEPQEYHALWGEYPLGYDPFPPVPSVEAVGIKPGETTRDRVAQLLGMPDRIMFEDRNAPWLYYVESDMLGSLRITFDDSGVVEDMSVYPDIIPYRISLGEIVEQYGDPDVVQLLVGLEGQKYENLGLLYLDRGLRVSASCVTPACNTVKRDGVVNQKWYFEATTLEGYQARFSKDPDYAPAYIEWHGFDE